jgi:hypothetical protein
VLKLRLICKPFVEDVSVLLVRTGRRSASETLQRFGAVTSNALGNSNAERHGRCPGKSLKHLRKDVIATTERQVKLRPRSVRQLHQLAFACRASGSIDDFLIDRAFIPRQQDSILLGAYLDLGRHLVDVRAWNSWTVSAAGETPSSS